jgi:outer membrane biosynthesis protein TonB
MPLPVLRSRASNTAAVRRDDGVARAALVLAASLLMHAVVITTGRQALRFPADEFRAGTLIEARLIAPTPPPRVESEQPPKRAPAQRRPVPAVPALAPVVAPEPAPQPAPEHALEPAPAPAPTPASPSTTAPTAAPEAAAEEPAPTPAEPASPAAQPAGEQAIPLPMVDSEFDASGDGLIADINDAKAQRAALPVSARYVYQTNDSRYAALTGTTTIRWRFDDDQSYAAQLVTKVLGISVLELNSQGKVARTGLVPDRYTEKTLSRAEAAANFNWDAGDITFSARNRERSLRVGAQDRLSFQFQLMALGQRLPHRFRTGAAISFPVGGRDDVTVYRFLVVGTETIATGVGDESTVRLERPKGPDGADSRIEVWLAPDMAWLPVKLRFTDRRGNITESVLSEYAIPAE